MSSDLLDDLIRGVFNDPFPDEVAPAWAGVLQRVPRERRAISSAPSKSTGVSSNRAERFTITVKSATS